MKPLFEKVAIVGTGLIGGSLGLALRRRKLAREVVGVTRTRQSIRMALSCGAIDSGSTDLGVIAGADCVVFAAPVNTICAVAPAVASLVQKNCVVTDAGSTKESIVRTLGPLFPGFVGAHPFAGSEKRSVAHARADLFEKSVCILTPVASTSPRALSTVSRLWSCVGCRIKRMDPRQHDQLAGFVSHLPHAAAFALVNSIPRAYYVFSGGGFKDTTRIAASDERLWADIFLSNRKVMARAFGVYARECARIAACVRTGNRAALVRLLRKARVAREGLR